MHTPWWQAKQARQGDGALLLHASWLRTSMRVGLGRRSSLMQSISSSSHRATNASTCSHGKRLDRSAAVVGRGSASLPAPTPVQINVGGEPAALKKYNSKPHITPFGKNTWVFILFLAYACARFVCLGVYRLELRDVAEGKGAVHGRGHLVVAVAFGDLEQGAAVSDPGKGGSRKEGDGASRQCVGTSARQHGGWRAATPKRRLYGVARTRPYHP